MSAASQVRGRQRIDHWLSNPELFCDLDNGSHRGEGESKRVGKSRRVAAAHRARPAKVRDIR